jgi:hypothetical protein
VGYSDKGEIICVGDEWLPGPSATVEAQEHGTSNCTAPRALNELVVVPSQMLDSNEIAILARQQVTDTWTLTEMRLVSSDWTVAFQAPGSTRNPFRYVVIDGKTGAVKSVSK